MKKKIVILVLTAVMCLAFTACNSGDSKYAKYDTLIQHLESGNYEQAQKEFDQLIGKPSNGNTEGEAVVDKNAAEKAAILGTWTSPTEGYSITFYADGTGAETATSENGKTTWKYDPELKCYVVSILSANLLITGTIQQEDGLTFFDLDGDRVYHSDCYEKAVQLEYQQVYESCMKRYENDSYTKAELRQTFQGNGNYTVTYTGAFKKDGKIHITAFLRNNTSEDGYYNPPSCSAQIIYDGAQHCDAWSIDFYAAEGDYDSYGHMFVPAGETIEIVAVINRSMDEVHFCAIDFTIFTPPMTYENYWIDLSEQLK